MRKAGPKYKIKYIRRIEQNKFEKRGGMDSYCEPKSSFLF
jgi:hypothetical protein